jgi:hypothetical protein
MGAGIALDECHRAKNTGDPQKEQKPGRKEAGSKTARSVQRLHEELKRARIIYVSATGASGMYA